MTLAPTHPAVRITPASRRGRAHLLATAMLVATLAGVAPTVGAQALPDVGVTVHVGQPGAYGRIDIGRVPPPAPALVYAQPIVVQAPPRQVVVVPQQPVYMHVPPGHRKHWAKHCAKYGACGVPVYFVREDWWQQQAAAHRGAGHGHGHDKHDRFHEKQDKRHDKHEKHHDKHGGRHGRDE